MGAHAQVAGNATAPQVRLETHARVDGNVSTNQLSKHSTASVGGSVGPYVAPLALPALDPIAPGTAQVVVPAQGVQALSPGSYASVSVQQQGRLVLAAGTYTLGTLSVAQHGTLEIQGPVVVRVASDLDLDHHVQVVLAAGLGAADVSWETLDPSVVIGHHVQLVGSLRAPSSMVEVQQETLVLGWIQARRVSRVPPASAHESRLRAPYDCPLAHRREGGDAWSRSSWAR